MVHGVRRAGVLADPGHLLLCAVHAYDEEADSVSVVFLARVWLCRIGFVRRPDTGYAVRLHRVAMRRHSSLTTAPHTLTLFDLAGSVSPNLCLLISR